MPSLRIEMELSGLDGIRSGISVTKKVWAIRKLCGHPTSTSEPANTLTGVRWRNKAPDKRRLVSKSDHEGAVALDVSALALSYAKLSLEERTDPIIQMPK
jgi:hypothetical protein